MAGMLGTVWLIICAMVFGGIMDAIGALSSISKALLKLFHTTFGLFASTVVSCLAINIAASDQYLAIVVPGKMYAKAYKEKDWPRKSIQNPRRQRDCDPCPDPMEHLWGVSKRRTRRG